MSQQHKPATAAWIKKRDAVIAARDAARLQVEHAQRRLVILDEMVLVFVDCTRCLDAGTDDGGGCGLCGLRPGEHGGYEGRELP